MSSIVLAVVGGGSVNWMSKLMRDVYLLDEVDGGEIRLVDPNAEYAKAVAGMLKAFNKTRKKNYKISVVTDRKQAFSGADFVLATFSPGSLDAFANDLEIPIKYGVVQPVSMTVGPSGISASLRTAPVAQEIVEDMEEVCPGAWLLNVTNPMSVVTRAMNAAAKTVRVVGMCHEFHCFWRFTEGILGLMRPEGMPKLEYYYQWLPEQGFDYTVAGLNHFIWLTEASLNGQDLIPRIRQYCIDHWDMRPPGSEDTPGSSWQSYQAGKFALCRTFGYLPLLGDRHLVEFLPSLCNVRNGYAMKYGVRKTTIDNRVRKMEQNLAMVQRIGQGREDIDWTRSDEEMTGIMRAIVTGTSIPAIVNLPNTGQITNMPRDSVVETLATVSADGATPKPSGALPGALGSLCRLHAEVQELTLHAALSGDRDLFVQALSIDPMSGCADFSELGEMADELLQANRQWLPRFHA